MTSATARRFLIVLLALACAFAVVVGGLVATGWRHRGDNAEDPAPSTTGSSRVTGSTPGTSTEQDNPPVAFFDPAAHSYLPAQKSPDRSVPAATGAAAGTTDPPAGHGLARYLSQRLDWRACDSLECATVLVPLDWDHPDGPAITLALRRAAASAQRQGTLFINPGGPGASGVDFVSRFPTQLFPGFDVVGWDTRGTGASTPVRCGTPAQTDAVLGVDQSPDTPAEVRDLRAALVGFSEECRAASGSLLDHISTIDTARDLDYLRFLVGDRRLNYLGISYGTFIGATYAEMYPTRVGRMVLDSAVDLTGKPAVSQAQGFDAALTSFAGWCATERACGLGDTSDAVISAVTGLFHRLDAEPLAVGDRTLSQSDAVVGTAGYLYAGQAGYSRLAAALAQALRGDGRPLLGAADVLNGRKADGSYDPIAYAFPAIGCLDADDPGWAAGLRGWTDEQRKAPHLGQVFGPSVQCSVWSARPERRMVMRAEGAAPIVVLGATGDPVTPYPQSVAMARDLRSGRLVTWQGSAHSAFMSGNTCVRQAVAGYINDNRIPAEGLTC